MNEIVAQGSWLLTAQLLWPLIGVVAVLGVGRKNEKGAHGLALLVSFLTFLWSLFVWYSFDSSQTAFQLVENVAWVPELGLRYAVGIDGVSVLFLPLTTFLTFIVLASAGSIHKNIRAYLISMLVLEVGMLGTFVALDSVIFYIFWEVMLIPMYFLIGVWGGERRIYAALKFVLYTAFGSLLMLVAIVYLGHLHFKQAGEFSFLLSDWANLRLTLSEERWLFAAFALAFAIKIPLFPLHTWLPDAHVEAPTGGSVILAGILLKMGLYGLIRFGMSLFPHATAEYAPLFVGLGVVGIVFGALVAWVQTDMKKLVAYSSVSHLGFCVLGYAVLSFEGLQGCILQMINHGISTGALFLLVGVLYDRKHTRLIANYGGLAQKVPLFSAVFLVFTLSSIGLPLTNGFVGEFLLLFASYQYHPIVALVSVTGVIFGALYMLSLYRRTVFGDFDAEKNGDLSDLSSREKFVFAPLLVLVFALGLFPSLVLDQTATSVRSSVQFVNSVNSKPQIPNLGAVSGNLQVSRNESPR